MWSPTKLLSLQNAKYVHACAVGEDTYIHLKALAVRHRLLTTSMCHRLRVSSACFARSAEIYLRMYLWTPWPFSWPLLRMCVCGVNDNCSDYSDEVLYYKLTWLFLLWWLILIELASGYSNPVGPILYWRMVIGAEHHAWTLRKCCSKHFGDKCTYVHYTTHWKFYFQCM